MSQFAPVSTVDQKFEDRMKFYKVDFIMNPIRFGFWDPCPLNKICHADYCTREKKVAMSFICPVPLEKAVIVSLIRPI